MLHLTPKKNPGPWFAANASRTSQVVGKAHEHHIVSIAIHKASDTMYAVTGASETSADSGAWYPLVMSTVCYGKWPSYS